MPTQPIADALGTPVAQNSFGFGFLLRRQRPVGDLSFEIPGRLLMERHWCILLNLDANCAVNSTFKGPFWLGCFGFLIDDTLCNSSQSFVCCFFFAQRFLEQRSGVWVPQLFSPGSKGAVT
jgi:hypothetical protein